MYFKFYRAMIMEELMNIKYGRERYFGLDVPRKIAGEKNQPVAFVLARMIYSLLVTGCTFKEYYNLNFANRTIKNQKTYITTGSNINAYNILNDKSLNHIYINKDEFNEKYSEFLFREWIDLSREKEDIYSFFKRHKDIIVKPKSGDSGKGISVLHNCGELTEADVDAIVGEVKSGIAEEVIYNHPKLSELNASSLNTMRIITVRVKDRVEILFAGIRFGAKGSEIDNISAGGRIAPIDIQNGIICGRSHTKKTVAENSEADNNFTGFQIPMWDELNDFLLRLTAVVPQMRYMAWDIAVTENGFAVIEGNHSSGNTVIQAHLSEKQPGLRVRLNQLIKEIKRSI